MAPVKQVASLHAVDGRHFPPAHLPRPGVVKLSTPVPTVHGRRFDPSRAVLAMERDPKVQFVATDPRRPEIRGWFGFDVGDGNSTTPMVLESRTTVRKPGEEPETTIDLTSGRDAQRDDWKRVSVNSDNSADAEQRERVDAMRTALGLPCGREAFAKRMKESCPNVPEGDMDDFLFVFQGMETIFKAVTEQQRVKAAKLPAKLNITNTVVGAIAKSAGQDQGAARLQMETLGKHRVLEVREADLEYRKLMQRVGKAAKAYQTACEQDPTFKKSVVSMMKEAAQTRDRKPTPLERKLLNRGHGPNGMLGMIEVANKEWAKRSRQGFFGGRRNDDHLSPVLEAVYGRLDDFSRAMTALNLGRDLEVDLAPERRAAPKNAPPIVRKPEAVNNVLAFER